MKSVISGKLCVVVDGFVLLGSSASRCAQGQDTSIWSAASGDATTESCRFASVEPHANYSGCSTVTANVSNLAWSDLNRNEYACFDDSSRANVFVAGTEVANFADPARKAHRQELKL